MNQPVKALDNNARRLARLAAVQGLYQIALTQESADALVRRFLADPAVLLQEEQIMIAVDGQMVARIVTGVCEHQASIDTLIGGAISERLSIDRLEPLLKAILRAGAFELHHCPSVAAGIIVNDYIDVAHGFFDAKDPGLVNAVLDKISKNIRA
jgi:N utilization substance protein B